MLRIDRNNEFQPNPQTHPRDTNLKLNIQQGIPRIKTWSPTREQRFDSHPPGSAHGNFSTPIYMQSVRIDSRGCQIHIPNAKGWGGCMWIMLEGIYRSFRSPFRLQCPGWSLLNRRQWIICFSGISLQDNQGR